jgi:hypothetical protein
MMTAVVAGPGSMDPPEWICPLLGIEVDAFKWRHAGVRGRFKSGQGVSAMPPVPGILLHRGK